MSATVLDCVTPAERVAARAAAAALRLAIADPSTMGAKGVGHIDFARPRRAVWFTTWANLPGFMRSLDRGGRSYSHALLPGWEYRRHEIRSEMIPDLEALAERRGAADGGDAVGTRHPAVSTLVDGRL